MARSAFSTPLVWLCLGLAVACSGPSSDSQAQVYEVRGMVRRLPENSTGPREIWIFHEAIADFVDIKGSVSGMKAMTMPFRIEDGISTEGLAPGDKVSFRLHVDWDGEVPVSIQDLSKLPADTPLDLGLESQAPDSPHSGSEQGS